TRAGCSRDAAPDAEQRLVVEELARRGRDERLAEDRVCERHCVSFFPYVNASHGVRMYPRASSTRTAVTAAPNVSAKVGLSMNAAFFNAGSATRIAAMRIAKLGREMNPAASV